MAVTSAQRRQVRELHQAKGRRKYSAFLAEGLVNVREALASPTEVRAVYGTAEALVTLAPELGAAAATEVGEAELARLSSQRSPHGAIAVVAFPDHPPEAIAAAARTLHLDGVSDPGNVGTLVRAAEWFGCGAVTAGPGSAHWYNPKVVAAARGSLFRLPHRSLDEGEAARLFAGSKLIIADLEGTEAAVFDWPSSGILCIGSESHGPSASITALSPKRVTLRAAAGSAAESLNAAVAGGILLDHWARAAA